MVRWFPEPCSSAHEDLGLLQHRQPSEVWGDVLQAQLLMISLSKFTDPLSESLGAVYGGHQDRESHCKRERRQLLQSLRVPTVDTPF